MKTIRLIIAGLVMTMGFSSCSSLFYDAKVDVLNSIQKGMSRQEVTKILGTPEYRRFDRDIEEWEYSRVLSGKSNITRTQIVVTFEGGRVVAMDSFSGEPRTLPVVPSEVVIDSPAPVYVRGMHPEDFRHFYEKVKSRPFKDDQIEMMRTVARNNSLNCVQCASLMALYTFDDDKMKVLNIFAPNIVDPENYEAILAHHAIYVYPRLEDKSQIGELSSTESEKIVSKDHPKIHLINAPVVEISSTFIRDNIKKGKNVLPLLSAKVWKYIDHNNFYKK